MEDRISIVVCSRYNDERREAIVGKIRNSCECNNDILFMYNPDGVALTKIYNSFLFGADNKNDVTVFVHDDVDFLKKGWGAEILRLFNKHKDYGIIGVAGSAYFDESAAWWRYDDKYGQVLHRHDGKSWVTAFSPLLKDDLQEVCVIDGLFMAVSKSRITHAFDEDFKFDFYDVSFCLSNFLDRKAGRIGVTTNIRLAHNSIGEMRDDWYTSRELLNEKYKDYYPIKVQNGKKKS